MTHQHEWSIEHYEHPPKVECVSLESLKPARYCRERLDMQRVEEMINAHQTMLDAITAAAEHIGETEGYCLRCLSIFAGLRDAYEAATGEALA